MSNNRMYLVCKTDQQLFCLGHYSIASSWKPNKNLQKDLKKFLSDHTHAYDDKGEDFYLAYENQILQLDPSLTVIRTNTDKSNCAYCGTKIGMEMKCPGCGWIDPPVRN